MSKSTDITKTRLIMERAERIFRERERETEQEIERLRLTLYPFRRAFEIASQAHYEALEANGQCRWCGLPKNKCEGHITLAATG